MELKKVYSLNFQIFRNQRNTSKKPVTQEEIKTEIEEYFELNESENTTYPNL